MTEAGANQSQWNPWESWETVELLKNEAFPEIGLLRLNRPDQLNAISDGMMDDMHRCLDLLSEAYDCRVVVLGGQGRVFCAGADLTTNPAGDQKYDWAKFPDRTKVFWQLQQKLSSAIAKLRTIPQPVICAVHRAAVGGGMAMANASDIVVASKGTKFINAFIKIGVSGADCGSSYYLPRILGLHRSAELLYTGRDLLAEQAYEWGYVNLLVDSDDEVVGAAVDFAQEYMLTKSPLGLRLTKEALNVNTDAGGLSSAMLFEDRNQTVCSQTEDIFEGVAAFFEKRKSQFGPR